MFILHKIVYIRWGRGVQHYVIKVVSDLRGRWFSPDPPVSSTNKSNRHQAQIQDFTLGGALLGEWSGDRVQGSARWGTGGKAPSKLLRIRKYRTSFLNWNWLKLYHVRHDHDAYNEVWYYTHDVTVRHCYNLNMKNSNQRLLLVPGKYVLLKVKCNRCRFLHDPERGSKDM